MYSLSIRGWSRDKNKLTSRRTKSFLSGYFPFSFFALLRKDFFNPLPFSFHWCSACSSRGGDIDLLQWPFILCCTPWDDAIRAWAIRRIKSPSLPHLLSSSIGQLYGRQECVYGNQVSQSVTLRWYCPYCHPPGLYSRSKTFF